MKIGLKKGFTLIELLIVIAIIGILSVALLPTILGAPAKGRDAARKAHLNAIVTALEAANIDLGGYPMGTNGVAQKVGITDTAPGFNTRLSYFQGGHVPFDPLGTAGPSLTGVATGRGQYLYMNNSGANGKNYMLVAYMEVPADANALWNDVSGLSAGNDPPASYTSSITTCAPFATTSPYAPVNNSCVYVVSK